MISPIFQKYPPHIQKEIFNFPIMSTPEGRNGSNVACWPWPLPATVSHEGKRAAPSSPYPPGVWAVGWIPGAFMASQDDTEASQAKAMAIGQRRAGRWAAKFELFQYLGDF